MRPHRLTGADARRIAVRAQLLDDDRPFDLLDVVRQLTALQNDLTNAVAPNAHLVLWSRLGAAYERHRLTDALTDGTLVELRNMIRPGEDLALYRAEMAAWPGEDAGGWERANSDWVTANDSFREDVLDLLKSDGPLTSREIPDTCVRPWRSSGWNNNRNAAMMLEMLELRGEVASTGLRRGRDRQWDLASRVYPDEPPVPIAQARAERDRRRLRSLGIAYAKIVGQAGEPAVVDGSDGDWRVDPAQLGQPFHGRVALLSPLDRLVFDRKRMVDIFAFDYQLEMYKPAAKRRWGYFALPILSGDRLVGKLDATSDRKAGVFRVDAVHQDLDWDTATATAIHAEVDALADWLDLEPRYVT